MGTGDGHFRVEMIAAVAYSDWIDGKGCPTNQEQKYTINPAVIGKQDKSDATQGAKEANSDQYLAAINKVREVANRILEQHAS